MRKLKEGEYFAPKNKEEYGFILKSLRDLGYPVYVNSTEEYYDMYPFLIWQDEMFTGYQKKSNNLTTKITLSDLFNEVETFEVDQKVLVRDSEESPWKFNRYGRYIEGTDSPHECVWSTWKFCIDYESNKDKHGKKN